MTHGLSVGVGVGFGVLVGLGFLEPFGGFGPCVVEGLGGFGVSVVHGETEISGGDGGAVGAGPAPGGATDGGGIVASFPVSGAEMPLTGRATDCPPEVRVE